MGIFWGDNMSFEIINVKVDSYLSSHKIVISGINGYSVEIHVVNKEKAKEVYDAMMIYLLSEDVLIESQLRDRYKGDKDVKSIQIPKE